LTYGHQRWAIAAYWPKTPPRLFWDADYAKATKFGGIVAPEDFNPFAWAVPTGEESALPFKLPGLIGGMILNGGTEDTFFTRMRPGDVISSKLRLASWEERELRSGVKLFSKYETEWHNQNDDLIKRRVGTTIFYTLENDHVAQLVTDAVFNAEHAGPGIPGHHRQGGELRPLPKTGDGA